MNVDVKISVIIPAYNCQNTISKSIDSIIAQSFKAHEIIVVDDGSSDNTFNYVSQKLNYINRKIKVQLAQEI